VDRVWAWVADLARHAEFSPKPYTMEWIQGEPNAVGSRYRSVGSVPGDSHRENEGEIVENRPMERFAFRAQDKDGATPTRSPSSQSEMERRSPSGWTS